MERKGRGIRPANEKKTLVLVPGAGCWTSVVQVPQTRGGGLRDLIIHAAGKSYPGSIADASSVCWTIVSGDSKQDLSCLVSIPLGDRISFNRETVPAIHVLARRVLSGRQRLFGNRDEVHALVLAEPVHELLSFSRSGSRHRLLDDKALDDFLAGKNSTSHDHASAADQPDHAKNVDQQSHSRGADVAFLDTRLRGRTISHPRLLAVDAAQLRIDKVGGLNYGGPSEVKRAVGLPVALLVLAVIGLVAKVIIERDTVVRDQKKLITRFERELSDYENLVSQVEDARRNVDALRSQLPVGVYSLLELLSQSFADGDRLLSFRYEHQNRTLTLTCVSADPIRLLDALSKSGVLTEVRSSGITPVDDHSGKMRVTLNAKVIQ